MEKVPFYAIKGSPVFESPLGLFNPDEDGAILEEDYGIPRRYLRSIMSPQQPPSTSSAATSASSAWSSCTLDPQPDRHRQDRTRRREQPGYIRAGRQGRHPQAGGIPAERRGRLQLFGRPLPGQPGPDGIRRDVQGPDQGPAPAADRDPGRQLQQHRRSRRPAPQRHHPGSLQRIGMAQFPQQQEQRGLHRPHLHRQGAVLPARGGRDQDLRQVAGQQLAGACPLRAGHPEDALAVLRAVEAERAGKLEYLLEDAGI